MEQRKLIRELTPETTEQELFDYITSFLMQQRYASVDENDLCKYRGTKGRMCAVGCIIPDKFYSKDLEQNTVGLILIRKLNITRGNELQYWTIIEKFLKLLVVLQDAHDGDILSEDDKYWAGKGPELAVQNLFIMKESFKTVAKQFNLEFDPKLYLQL